MAETETERVETKAGAASGESAGLVVSCREVSRTYEDDAVPVHALRDVDFDLRAGEWTSLAGPSGSGKSTLLHAIGGLDQPSSGTVVPFPPNPPPISIGTTLTRETGTPSMRDVWSRTEKCPWLLHQTVTKPSRVHWAVAACGSM